MAAAALRPVQVTEIPHNPTLLDYFSHLEQSPLAQFSRGINAVDVHKRHLRKESEGAEPFWSWADAVELAEDELDRAKDSLEKMLGSIPAPLALFELLPKKMA